MRKKAALALAVLLLAAIVRSIVAGPSTLEVRLKVEEDGPDLVPQPHIYVGYVARDETAQPTLGNIALIRPKEGTENIYDVPSNRRVGIFVIILGVAPFGTVVTVEPGQHLPIDVVLDAGIVRVATEQELEGR